VKDVKRDRLLVKQLSSYLEKCLTDILAQTDRQTDGQTDRQTGWKKRRVKSRQATLNEKHSLGISHTRFFVNVFLVRQEWNKKGKEEQKERKKEIKKKGRTKINRMLARMSFFIGVL